MQRTLVERAQRGDREAFTDLAAAALGRDMRFALRSLLRVKGLAATVVLVVVVRSTPSRFRSCSER